MRWSRRRCTAAGVSRMSGKPNRRHHVVPGGPADREFHLRRVCSQFPKTISVESARRLARLFEPEDRAE